MMGWSFNYLLDSLSPCDCHAGYSGLHFLQQPNPPATMMVHSFHWQLAIIPCSAQVQAAIDWGT